MIPLLNRALLSTLACLVVTASHAQIFQAIGTFKRGQNVLEFYEDAIINTQNVVYLSTEISNLFRNKRYEELNNEFVQKNGLLDFGPFGLKYVEIKPEASQNHKYDYHSITLKKVNFKKCEILSKNEAFNNFFLEVQLNDDVISSKSRKLVTAKCKKEGFFKDGINELKYINR